MTLLDELEDLCDLDESLSPWEADFTDDMMKRVQEGKPLTQKMQEKIRELWGKRC